MNYSIGQVAKMKHLSISQLRYYDNQGLFPFLKRTEKGDRFFDDDALKFLGFILCLKDTGMPIKDIKHYVDLSMSGSEATPQRLEMMNQLELKIKEQIREMEDNLSKIQQKISRLKREAQT